MIRNILATRFIGKIYDDMKPIEIGTGIIGVKGIIRVQCIINIVLGIAIVIMLMSSNCEIYNILAEVSAMFCLSISFNLSRLYVGNKYAMIQERLVKLDDIESVTKSEVTKKSNVSRSEFKVRTKKGKLYIVSCDKRKEDNIEELSKGISTGTM